MGGNGVTGESESSSITCRRGKPALSGRIEGRESHCQLASLDPDVHFNLRIGSALRRRKFR